VLDLLKQAQPEIAMTSMVITSLSSPGSNRAIQ
jgi:hypothetical protein